MSQKETKVFQTEVKEILNLMIHSLYSHREIFLRELISNASDALAKLRYEEIANPELGNGEEKHIRLTPDREHKTLSIQDNGIGMSYDDLVQNIGTVAYSGTKQFLKKTQELKDKPDMIGQFGVGFYSVFMVADKVVVHTQKAGSAEGWMWESHGEGEYTVEPCPRPQGCGTTITLYLKEIATDDAHIQDFSDDWTLKALVRKYSDFIEFPIKMQVTKEDPEFDAEGKVIEGSMKTTIEDETLNSQKAIWLRPAKDLTEDQYNEFYKHLTHDWQNPTDKIHYKAEGTQEFSSLLFIPETVPMDYNQRDMKYGLSLYVQRVFIQDNCEQLLPTYLRFLKGVVDSSDLPLNVSREMVQKDKHIELIKKALVIKALKHLKNMMEKDLEKYTKFYKSFGATLKEGVSADYTNKSILEELLMFYSTASDHYTTLKDYVTRMKPDQKCMYYMTGESLNHIKQSPYLEKLRQKGYEVLYLIDPVDEWVVNSIHEFDGKALTSITKGALDLGDADSSKEEEKKSQEEYFKPLTEKLLKTLGEHVKEVKISDRLVESPVCLVSGAQDPSAHLERMMESMGQKMPRSKRILEINPKHPIFEKMLGFEEDKQALWAEILLNQALLNEGSILKDPVKFSRQISELMVHV